MVFRVIVSGGKEGFSCLPDQTVLAAMTAAGSGCIRVGCRGGGCGVCRVQVTEGRFVTGVMSSAQVDTAERAAGIALACQLYPRSDLQLRVLGRKPSSPSPHPQHTAGQP